MRCTVVARHDVNEKMKCADNFCTSGCRQPQDVVAVLEICKADAAKGQRPPPPHLKFRPGPEAQYRPLSEWIEDYDDVLWFYPRCLVTLRNKLLSSDSALSL